MSDLKKVREWIKTFEGIPESFQIDYTSEVPQNAGLYPNGVQEISRREDILGNITVTNQYNFGLYTVFIKPENEDVQSTLNAEWVMSFQQWVQDQSARGLAPTFGNTEQDKETVTAQNGSFFGDKERGVGVYMVIISAKFKKYYGE